MNVFQTHSGIVEDYATYIRSFLNIADPTILEVVDGELNKGKLWPEPLLQFNPSFEMVGSVAAFANTGTLHPDIADIENALGCRMAGKPRSPGRARRAPRASQAPTHQ